ncbi:DUF7389 domain-containing protein [Halobellus captivus]|uniref:DUF7389 domain-containing protein n=1 Tax=Halobellus captivus TaxID=2592614 RepID=UPI0011A7AB41|nr:hypothetical protein [Halobellus captivus]
MTEDDIELTVKMTRGGSSGNKESMKATVSAPNIETLNDRVNKLREKMEDWSVEFRNIQPGKVRQIADDQSQLGESEA